MRSGAYSLPGPLRRSSAHVAAMSEAVAADVAVQLQQRAARQGPFAKGDANKGTLEMDSLVVVVVVVVVAVVVVVVVVAVGAESPGSKTPGDSGTPRALENSQL